ncbi:MAG: winged helix-turn-helix transcriptional regulator [Sandaracinaceae bacterium]|nr:winged helix-turn-helix transcriptional regulator [Sandaracinaceae bacterium]
MSETASRIADGLGRLARVLRKGAWEGAGARGLTPTQGEILRHVAAAASPPRLGAIAKALGVRPATASKAVSALLDKGLVQKTAAPEDARALALTLTAKGRREATRAEAWPEVVASVAAGLDEDEQAVLLRSIVKLIRRLQLRGEIDARTCAGCAYFRPYAHPRSAAPHHCAFVDAPFGDAALRVDCPDFVEAPEGIANEIRTRFLRVVG